MVTAIQVVSSINTASTLPSVARISVLTTEAGTSAEPSTIVTLGDSSSETSFSAITDPLTYNAAGLLGSLLPLSEPAGESAAGSVTFDKLAVLLGPDGDTTANNTGAGILDPPLSQPSLPADTRQALTELLENAPNTGATDLDATPAIDIIQTLPPGSTTEGIAAISTNAASDPEPSAAVPATETSDSSLLSFLSSPTPPPLSEPTDATNPNLFNTQVTDTNLEATPVGITPSADSNGALEDIATSDTAVTPAVQSQSRAATDLAAEAAAVRSELETLPTLPATAASATGTTTQTSADNANIAGLATAATEITTDTATPPVTATAITPAAAIPAAAPSNAAALNFEVHAVAQAVSNISGNPAYAYAAAALYLNAAIVRSQTHTTTIRPESVDDAAQPITPIQGVMPISSRA